MSANIRFEDWLEERMTDPEFRAEWEASAPGYQVAVLRIRRGMTQAELAELVGTKQSSIARLESGKAEPRLSFLRRVVEALGGRLTIQVAGREELARQEATAPSVRAAVHYVTVGRFTSGPAQQLADMRVVAAQRTCVVDQEYNLPDWARLYSYPSFTNASAKAKTVRLQ